MGNHNYFTCNNCGWITATSEEKTKKIVAPTWRQGEDVLLCYKHCAECGWENLVRTKKIINQQQQKPEQQSQPTKPKPFWFFE